MRERKRWGVDGKLRKEGQDREKESKRKTDGKEGSEGGKERMKEERQEGER